jgi:hypothetical protein
MLVLENSIDQIVKNLKTRIKSTENNSTDELMILQ